MKIKAVFFDLDDTLINTTATVSIARKKAIKAMFKAGLNQERLKDVPKLMDKALNYFGSTLYELVLETIARECCLEIHNVNIKSIIKEGFVCYEEYLEKLSSFPDVKPTLDKLKDSGFIIGLISNGDHDIQMQKIKKCGLEVYFNDANSVISSSFGSFWGKPAPYIYKYLADRMKVSTASSIYIGNLHSDVIGANLSGMVSVLFQDIETSGYKSNSKKNGDIPMKLEKPDFAIDNISQIFDIIEQVG